VHFDQRLGIPDITHVEDQKAIKGSFKLNEIIRKNASLFSIKDIFTTTIKPIENIKWVGESVRSELVSPFTFIIYGRLQYCLLNWQQDGTLFNGNYRGIRIQRRMQGLLLLCFKRYKRS